MTMGLAIHGTALSATDPNATRTVVCMGSATAITLASATRGGGGMTAWRGYRARMSVQMAIATTVPAGVKTAGWATTAASPHVRATARSTANVSV